MVYAVNILKTCHWCGQFSSGHLEHLQSDHKDHLKCHYKKTMKWQMQGFCFIKHLVVCKSTSEDYCPTWRDWQRWISSQPIGAVFLCPWVLFWVPLGLSGQIKEKVHLCHLLLASSSRSFWPICNFTLSLNVVVQLLRAQLWKGD